MIYINSTLEAQRIRAGGTHNHSIHYWSYTPTELDTILCHKINRYEIKLRSYLKTWDPLTSWKVLRDYRLSDGNIYLVTQPDFIRWLPLIRRSNPSAKLITWVWTPDEVKSWKKYLKACNLILCLTDAALLSCNEHDLGGAAELGLWECDIAELPDLDLDPKYDVALTGISERNVPLTQETLIRHSLTSLCSKSAHELYRDVGSTLVDDANPKGLFSVYSNCKSCLVLTKQFDPRPVGYTNISEALLSGCPIITESDSTIPSSVKALPGYLEYQRGNAQSLAEMIEECLNLGSDLTARQNIKSKARALLASGHTRKLIKGVIE